MKKIFIKCISFVLSCSLFLALCQIGVSASGETLPTPSPTVFTVTSVKGIPDKLVHVEVRISENSQIASAGLELLFDSSKLLVSDYSIGDAFTDGMNAINANISDKVVVSYISIEPLLKGGTAFSVDFKVTSDTLNEKLDIQLVTTELTDVNGNAKSSQNGSGTVEVVELLYGDMNADNKVSVVDALKILSAATEEITLTGAEQKAGDVNGDGKVSVSDALQVLYFTAEVQNDFQIYQVAVPTGVQVTSLNEYNFSVSWNSARYILGYNVYLNGNKINTSLLTGNTVTIGGSEGDTAISPEIHASIDHNTDYTISITAVNALKETEKSDAVSIKTKRAYSYVTFKDWDGTMIGTPQKVLYGQNAVLPASPVREGYVFTGWDKQTTNVVDDLTVTAQYDTAKYNYTFKDWNDTVLYTQNIVHGGTVTPPKNPIKTGYTFAGWFTQNTGGEKVTNFSAVTSAKTVYAQYTINTYTATFNSNGGTSVANTSAQYQSLISKPANPTKLGFSFGGWYREAGLVNQWTFTSDKITGNITLFAKWIPIVIAINKSEVTLTEIGEKVQLTASITGGSDTLIWDPKNINVAEVDQSGNVTAKGNGTVMITVTGVNSKVTASCTVKVILKNNSATVVSGTLLQKINTLRTKFPSGKYWNHKSGRKTTLADLDSYTSTPCNHNNHFNDLDCSRYTFDPICGCNSTALLGFGAIQCKGFAYKVFYDLYGKIPDKNKCKNIDRKFDSLQVGDYVRLYYGGHSVVIIEKSSDYIKVVECNWPKDCIITWDRKITKSTLDQKDYITSVIRA